VIEAPTPTFTIRPLSAHDCDRVGEVDIAARAAATLGFLGPAFFATLYRTLIVGPHAVGFVAEANGRLIGFVLGTMRTRVALRDALQRSAVRLAARAAAALARRPGRIGDVLAALRYPGRAHADGAELLVIAVAPDWQGRGVGRALTRALDVAFRAYGIAIYRVTAKARVPGVEPFYRGLGFTSVETFDLFGEPWTVYERASSDADGA
jgi:ribosomal protein S18 acetylase RimI-like enzyme